MKNLPTQLWETGKENLTRKSINKKPPKLNKKIWEKNQRYVWWEKKLGRNKVLFSFQRNWIVNGQTTKCRPLNATRNKKTDLRLLIGFWL